MSERISRTPYHDHLRVLTSTGEISSISPQELRVYYSQPAMRQTYEDIIAASDGVIQKDPLIVRRGSEEVEYDREGRPIRIHTEQYTLTRIYNEYDLIKKEVYRARKPEGYIANEERMFDYITKNGKGAVTSITLNLYRVLERGRERIEKPSVINLQGYPHFLPIHESRKKGF